MQKWHVMYTKPKREELVEVQLLERGIETYFPHLKVERGYGRGVRLEPFFPHYLFFKADLGDSDAQGLQWLPGVRSIVHVADRPASVPDDFIEVLQDRLAPYGKKALRKSELLFKSGQKVVVTGGPFEGAEGIFQKGLNGRDRVQILLNLVGTWTRTEISATRIKPLRSVPGAAL